MKENVRVGRSTMIIVLMLAIIFVMGMDTVQAAERGKISSATNVTSGVLVKWSKDKSKDGYKVYRKTGSSKYELIKTVKGSKKTSWTDTGTINGKKYTYCVKAYKGKRVDNTKGCKTIYRLYRPSIEAIVDNSFGGIKVSLKENIKATGYEIVYSKKSSFSSPVVKKGSSTIRNISGLDPGSKYYIKVRAYKKVGSKTYYSEYSTSKSFTLKAYYDAYVKVANIAVRNSPDFNSEKSMIVYNTHVCIYKDAKTISTGTWKKLKINGKYCYTYVKKGENPFTTIIDPLDFSKCGKTEIQQKIIDEAIRIYLHEKTEYSHDNTISAEGAYKVDCSGFTSLVINRVINEYNPVYKLSKDVDGQYNTTLLVNGGYEQEYSAEIVQNGGAPDYSKLQPGDLLFFKEDGVNKAGDYNHVGIYLGQKKFIHSTPYAKGVGVYPLEGRYEGYFVRALRVIPSNMDYINIEKKTNGNVRVYTSEEGARKYSNDTSLYTVISQRTVKLLYTNNVVVSAEKSYCVGYISYDTDEGIKYGYVFSPGTKLLDISE